MRPPDTLSEMKIDPFADFKRQVLETLRSWGVRREGVSQTELEQKARQALQEVLSEGMTPMTLADRARLAREVADELRS